MQLDRVYQVLAKVGLDADLQMIAPNGSLVQLRTDPETYVIHIRCSESSGVKDLFRLARAAGTTKFNLTNLRRLRSPLIQDVVVSVQEDKILTWAAGRYPRVHGLRRLLRLI